MQQTKTPAPRRAGTAKADRDEWLALMLEIAAADRDEYRRLRALAWERVALSHEKKTPAELQAWRDAAS